MLAPNYSSQDFGHALQRLLPTGPAWTREPDAVSGQVMQTQGPSYFRLHARANYLLTDGFPSSTLELLPEWELSLGLPDPCAGPSPTIEQRQQQVVARLAYVTGPSRASIIAFAAALGYPITITEFAPARYGSHVYGQPVYGSDFAFAWRANAPTTTIEPAQYGRHHYGEPYVVYGNQVLQCELERINPAHLTFTVAYSSANYTVTN